MKKLLILTALLGLCGKVEALTQNIAVFMTFQDGTTLTAAQLNNSFQHHIDLEKEIRAYLPGIDSLEIKYVLADTLKERTVSGGFVVVGELKSASAADSLVFHVTNIERANVDSLYLAGVPVIGFSMAATAGYPVFFSDLTVDSLLAPGLNLQATTDFRDSIGVTLTDSFGYKARSFANGVTVTISGTADVDTVRADCLTVVGPSNFIGEVDILTSTNFKLAGTSITATATEINLIDGYTGTTANLNTLTDGSDAAGIHTHGTDDLADLRDSVGVTLTDSIGYKKRTFSSGITLDSISVSSSLIINPSTTDKDFRLCGDSPCGTTAGSETPLIFGDAGNDRVGIGTASPDGALHVQSGSAGSVSPHAVADEITVEGSGITGITVLSPDANAGMLYFGNPSDNLNAGMESYYNGGSPYLTLNVDAGVERMRIDASGNVGIGTTSPDGKLDVSGASPVVYITETSGAGGQLRINGANPSWHLYEDDATANEGRWDVNASGDKMNFRSINDAEGAADTWLIVDRAAQTVSSATLNTPLVMGAGDKITTESGADLVIEAPATNRDIELNYNGTTMGRWEGSTLGLSVGIDASHAGTNYPLNVGSSAGSNLRLIGRDNGSADEAAIAFQHFDGSTLHGQIVGTTSYMQFYGGSTVGLTIANDGGLFGNNLLAAAASTDVNINGSNEIHSVTSSPLYKTNMRDSDFGGRTVLDLRPRAYTFGDTSRIPYGWPKPDGTYEDAFGLDAAEVYAVFPEIVQLRATMRDSMIVASRKDTIITRRDSVAKDSTVVTLWDTTVKTVRDTTYQMVKVPGSEQPYSVQYEKIGLLLIPDVKYNRSRIDSLEARVDRQQVLIDSLFGLLAR